MTGAEIGGLAILGIIDGTSFGTLVVPLWLTLSSTHSSRGVVVYLCVLQTFYWLIGVVVILTGGGAIAILSQYLDETWWARMQLAVGSIILLVGLIVDRSASRTEAPSPRMEKWRRRVESSRGVGGASVLALGAGMIELGSMVPYIAALGTLVRSALQLPVSLLLLSGYVVLMITPFLLLTWTRRLAHGAASRLLERVERRAIRASDTFIGVALIVVGALIASDAANQIGIFPF